MSKLNVLLLFSDEHRRDALGCYGHPLVRTPNLDALAARGTRFTRAYTPSPICVPARAALATGQYVHATRCWSNAQAYCGSPRSWGHQLQAQGHRVDAIGKLHYRGREYDNGFDRELQPLYVHGGQGWIKGLLRNHEAVLDCSSYAREIGPGDDRYTDYDLSVTRAACEWLQTNAKEGVREGENTDKPWTLFVSWLRPHYPLICPPDFYKLYPLAQMDQARFIAPEEALEHPVLRTIHRNFNYDEYFNDHTRQIARASYYGLCSFLDHQVGQVLQALEASGQAENTLIIYTSDHGDHNGDRGLWTKMTLYDESTGIPLIIAGPGIPKAQVSDTLASLVDIYPSVLTATGAKDDGQSRPGIALQALAQSATEPGRADAAEDERCILSEYHDGGAPTGLFMLRNARWKYNYYPGYPAELYDMCEDPEERDNLATSERHSEVVASCHRQLQAIADPDAVNRLAFADQAERIAQLGGVEAILASEEYDFTPVED